MDTETEPKRPWQVRIDKPIAESVAGLPGQAAAVFLAVASFADADGLCWPKYETLNKLTGRSKSQVKRAMKVLTTAGVLTIEHRAGSSNYYRLGGVTSDPTPEKVVSPVTRGSGHGRPGGQVTGDTQKEATEKDTTKKDAQPDGCSSPRSFGDLQKAWNKIPGVCQCLTATPKRRAAFRARMAEKDGEKYIREALAKVAASDFCRGKIEGKDWRATIDWFLRANKVTEIREGAFDNGNSNGEQGKPLIFTKNQPTPPTPPPGSRRRCLSIPSSPVRAG